MGKEGDSTNYTQMISKGNVIATLLNEPGDINLNSTFYLTQNIIIASCNKYKKLMRHFHLFCSTSSKSNVYFIFYTFSLEPAMFQVLCRHMWFLANIGLCSYWPVGYWHQHNSKIDWILAKPEAKAEWGREGRPLHWPLLANKGNYLFHLLQPSSETYELLRLRRKKEEEFIS